MYSGAAFIDNKKLSKVLAYVGSDHEGEALAALHAVRRIINGTRNYTRDSLPLSRDTLKPSAKPPQKQSTSPDRKTLLLLDKLKDQLATRSQEISEKSKTIAELNGKIEDLEALLNQKKCEAEGWKKRAWKHYWSINKL